MKYRTFGSTGFEVSALGLGCMRLPTQRLRLQKINVPEAIRIIRSAVDRGVNYIDTGWPYHFGESERVLGDALQDGYREKVHLVTKSPVVLPERSPISINTWTVSWRSFRPTIWIHTFSTDSLRASSKK
jgi:predicted aldo/keto reductase-like oxidoreductase